MILIYRTIFTVMFGSKSDRADFQTKIIAAANKIVSDLGLKTRVISGPDLTGDTEKGYQWFDKSTLDPIWASRIIFGFTDESENVLFHNALVSQFGTKDSKYAYMTDEVGKVGAFNKDLIPVREVSDVPTQVELK